MKSSFSLCCGRFLCGWSSELRGKKHTAAGGEKEIQLIGFVCLLSDTLMITGVFMLFGLGEKRQELTPIREKTNGRDRLIKSWYQE